MKKLSNLKDLTFFENQVFEFFNIKFFIDNNYIALIIKYIIIIL